MKIKLLSLLLSLSLATVTLFSLTGCALKSSCNMKNNQSCPMSGKEKSCNCDMKDGKCSCDMKKDMKGSCGAGKCGAEMKKEMKDEMKDTKKEMKDEMKGSYGAGKCGSQ